MSRTGLYLTSGLTLGKVIWRGECTGNNYKKKQTSKKETNKKQKQSNENFENL